MVHPFFSFIKTMKNDKGTGLSVDNTERWSMRRYLQSTVIGSTRSLHGHLNRIFRLWSQRIWQFLRSSRFYVSEHYRSLPESFVHEMLLALPRILLRSPFIFSQRGHHDVRLDYTSNCQPHFLFPELCSFGPDRTQRVCVVFQEYVLYHGRDDSVPAGFQRFPHGMASFYKRQG
jgi:hypothetical protein